LAGGKRRIAPQTAHHCSDPGRLNSKPAETAQGPRCRGQTKHHGFTPYINIPWQKLVCSVADGSQAPTLTSLGKRTSTPSEHPLSLLQLLYPPQTCVICPPDIELEGSGWAIRRLPLPPVFLCSAKWLALLAAVPEINQAWPTTATGPDIVCKPHDAHGQTGIPYHENENGGISMVNTRTRTRTHTHTHTHTHGLGPWCYASRIRVAPLTA
jgi:hypothetical protein